MKYCRNSAKKTLRLVKIPPHDLMNGVFISGATAKNEGENGQKKAIKYPALTTRFRMQQGVFYCQKGLLITLHDAVGKVQ